MFWSHNFNSFKWQAKTRNVVKIDFGQIAIVIKRIDLCKNHIEC